MYLFMKTLYRKLSVLCEYLTYTYTTFIRNPNYQGLLAVLMI